MVWVVVAEGREERVESWSEGDGRGGGGVMRAEGWIEYSREEVEVHVKRMNASELQAAKAVALSKKRKEK